MKKTSVILILLLLIPRIALGALNFDDSGGTSRVDFGSGASLDNLGGGTSARKFTLLAWVRPDNGTGLNKFLLHKANSGTSFTSGWAFLVPSGAGTGNIQFLVDRVTTDTNYEANVGLVNSQWQFVGGSFDSAVADSGRLYRGTLTSGVAEFQDGTPTNGAGSFQSDADNTLKNGWRGDATSEWDGRVAWVGIWDRQLTLGEIRLQQFFPTKTSGNVLFAQLGWAGTATVGDWSGSKNTGTGTFVSQAAHVPIWNLFFR